MPRAMAECPTRPLLAALALVAVPLLTGCGEPPNARLPTGRVLLTLGEYTIRPQSVSVPAGRIRIVARNAGVVPHNVVVESRRRDSSGNAVIYGGVSTLLPGQTGNSKVLRLTPGRYLLVSTIANQADLGMNGTLIVRAGS
jgi:hypothetical protein